MQTLDPKDVLYSLPTFCYSNPPITPSKAPGGSKALHGDDWRQVEFVVRTNQN